MSQGALPSSRREGWRHGWVLGRVSFRFSSLLLPSFLPSDASFFSYAREGREDFADAADGSVRWSTLCLLRKSTGLLVDQKIQLLRQEGVTLTEGKVAGSWVVQRDDASGLGEWIWA